MGNCLRLGISRIGLAWSKWRTAAKFKRKNISIIILGMQAVGKSTIALRLYKFKRTLPDTNYVQTKGFNSFTVKRKKTTINIYDLGGHPSIQELWDHYYADAHGVIFVVDTSNRDTVPEASHLLSKVLSDYRVRGKPVLLLANKIDLDGVSESDLDSMLNLQQIVNSARCLTRLDVSCATDLKNDNGIFDGFKWLVTHIESNFVEINDRVLSDTLEEKNREKARREAVKAARLAEKEAEEAEIEARDMENGTPSVHASLTPPLKTPPKLPTPPTSAPSTKSLRDGEDLTAIPNLVQETENPAPAPQRLTSPPSSKPSCRVPSPISRSKTETSSAQGTAKRGSPLISKIPLPLLPPIHANSSQNQFVEQPIKLPRLKSPKSRPEVISRIEDLESSFIDNGNKRLISKTINNNSDQQYTNEDEKGFRFRKISAARRLSPEGADSDDGIVNMAFEPTEDVSSDSTPIGGRRHNFVNGESRELFMVTTLAEVHKEYFKDRKGSTSTHDSISMSITSEAADSIIDDGQSGNASLSNKTEENVNGNVQPDQLNNLSKKSSIAKGKSKKRLNIKSRHNKTAPLEPPLSLLPTTSGPSEALKSLPPMASISSTGTSDNGLPSQLIHVQSQSASPHPEEGHISANVPFTISNAWDRNTSSLESEKLVKFVNGYNGERETENVGAAERY